MTAEAPLEVLGIGAHPDDVELGCGGTLALLAGAGRRVGILHLTRGERGTRGSAAERRREAESAAAALGAVTVEFLDCGDGALRTGEAEEDALIAALRRLRPELVLGPTPHDRHPDHGRAHQLVHDGCFYAGLAPARRRATAPPGGRLLVHAARPLQAQLRRRRHRELAAQARGAGGLRSQTSSSPARREPAAGPADQGG